MAATSSITVLSPLPTSDILTPDVLNHDLYAKDLHCSPPGAVDHMWVGIRWLAEGVTSSFSYFLSLLTPPLFLHSPSEGYMFGGGKREVFDNVHS